MEIIINYEGDKEDIILFLEYVKSEIEQGFVRGEGWELKDKN